MTQVTYTQCKLVRGSQEDIAWIESRFATPGRNIRIEVNDAWEDWTVAEVYGRQSRQHVEEHERDYRRIVTFQT